MFCRACGNQVPDNARFCPQCGAPIPQGDTTPTAPPGRTGYGPPPTGPEKRGRAGLWVGIAAAVVIIIAVAVAAVLLLKDKETDVTTETTGRVESTAGPVTTATTAPPTTSAPTSTAPTTSTTVTLPVAGPPGDSSGAWVEVDISSISGESNVAAVSEQALLFESWQHDQHALLAYLFDSAATVELPIDAAEFYAGDLDKVLAVWWEGTYDQDTGEYRDQHIYAFRLPDGPKVEVAGPDRAMWYPQVAGKWITWVEGQPWENNPDEYYLVKVLGVQVDNYGRPVSEPAELVPAATAPALGDAVWVYSLSETHLAWEQAAPVDLFEAGTYVMDLAAREPLLVGSEAWRPSVKGDKVVYFQQGLKVVNVTTGEAREIDPAGDFPTAALTYAAYYRSTTGGGQSKYEIVTRGYNGNHEQVLGVQSTPPWLSPAIAASDTRVAFTIDGAAYLFEWQSQ